MKKKTNSFLVPWNRVDPKIVPYPCPTLAKCPARIVVSIIVRRYAVASTAEFRRGSVERLVNVIFHLGR